MRYYIDGAGEYCMPRNRGKLVITPLTVPQMKRLNKGEKEYHVFKDRKEFVTVEAEMASEAKEKSGIEHPPIIRHSSLHIANVIDISELEKTGHRTFYNDMAEPELMETTPITEEPHVAAPTATEIPAAAPEAQTAAPAEGTVPA